MLFKSSNEPLITMLNNDVFSRYLSQFNIGNSIIFNISIGYIVSYIFWVLNIAIPAWLTKREHKKVIVQDYINFKKQVIQIFFNAHSYCIDEYEGYDEVKELYDIPQLEDKLLDPTYFYDYFTKTNSQDWGIILNGLGNKEILRDLQLELRLFERKLEAFLSYFGKYSKKSKKYFNFYRDLTDRLEKSTVLEHDRAKYYDDMLFSVFANWDQVSIGKLKEDVIMGIINNA